MSRKNTWVVTGGKTGEVAHCTRCGEGLVLGLPLGVTTFVEVTKGFVKAHNACKPGSYSPPVLKTVEEWREGRDTGTSSLTIWSVLTGRPTPHRTYDAPHDPADFGRCYRLLQLCPEWRARLKEVAAKCKAFAPMVKHWDELSQLYELEEPSGNCPRLYQRIQELRGRA